MRTASCGAARTASHTSAGWRGAGSPACRAREPRRACAGALLAVGVLNCGVQHENDPAYALLYDFVEKPDATIRIGAIMGLGLAYAGARATGGRRPPPPPPPPPPPALLHARGLLAWCGLQLCVRAVRAPVSCSWMLRPPPERACA